MKHYGVWVFGLSASLLLGGCAQTPMGPQVPVMPAANKPFEVFQQDQMFCKQFAEQQVGGQAESANQRAVGGAVLGTVLGAGLGAAIGGGQGAGIGAASGALVGTGAGAGYSANQQIPIQQQYDNAYSQCMYSRGNQVPGFQPAGYAPPPPPPAMAPPAPPPAPVAARSAGYDRALVRDTQAELQRVGLLNGPADGSYGPQTGAAISEYQRRYGLLVDGRPSPALLDYMRSH